MAGKLKKSINFLKTHELGDILRFVGVDNLLRILVRSSLTLRLGEAKLRFEPDEWSFFVELKLSIHRLKERGFSVTGEGSTLVIEGYPYLMSPLVFESKTPVTKQALWTTMELLRYCYTFGGMLSVGNHNVSDASRGLAVDTKLMVVTTSEGARFSLEGIDPWTFCETFVLRIHETENLSGKIVLDIGSEAGDTPLYYAAHGARVFAVEPVSINYAAMMKNLELNPGIRDRVTPVKKAVGPNGKLRLSYQPLPNALSGGASVYEANGTGSVNEEVDSLTVSDLLDELDLNDVDVLKMDCKGCEWLLTKMDISRVKETVKVEWTYGTCERITSLLRLLKEEGFEPQVYLHNPCWHGKVEEHGTIVARRRRIL